MELVIIEISTKIDASEGLDLKNYRQGHFSMNGKLHDDLNVNCLAYFGYIQGTMYYTK